jgi:HD-GYP domain-containing protein (c-di-GMP phosphodiesterase class II)
LEYETTTRPELIRLESLMVATDFLDSISTGIILQGVDGAVIDCNTRAAELLGVPEDELMGRTLETPLGAVREDGTPLPPDAQPAAITLRTGEPCKEVIIGIDSPDDARRWLTVDTWPLNIGGERVGVITAFDDYSVAWKEQHFLRLLSEVNRVVMFSSNEESSLQQLCDALVRHGPYALAWVGVPSATAQFGIEMLCASGETEYLFDGMVSWSGTKESGLGPVGTALRTGITQVINNLLTDPRFEMWRDRAEKYGLRACIAIPSNLDDQRAVLAVYDRHIHAFDAMGVKGLEDIAREVEFGIEHLRSLRSLEKALEGTLAALSQMTETRDPYTAGHQSHVGRLSAAIARQMGQDDKMVALIGQSGEVHDIGKITIPTEILTRPGRLSALEFEMVKQHPVVGYEILTKASLPWPIADVALQHHERMDGSGYPSGLPGSDIVIPARIVAVADVVDAMFHRRPYREGLGLDGALAEIARGAGTLYDADVAAACQRVFHEGFTFVDEPDDLAG